MSNVNINEVWNRTMEVLKQEVSSPVSYQTWLVPTKPLTIRNDEVFVIETPSKLNKNILNENYKSLIISAIHKAAGREYSVEIVAEGEYSVPVKSSSDDQSESPLLNSDVHNLNPKYVFEEFVIGNSNRFAHAASLAVAESPAKAYNPLFIYGGVGLGKTHLMHAIGHFILTNKPTAKIAYVTSESFTNELINSIKDDKNAEFREKYRNVDVLLVDDIQFIGGKERTQEEFFHTFNALHQSNKQIILSSDRPPRDIPTLEDRLRSRFEWGLIADIQPPDFETRIAILRKKAETEHLSVPDDVFEFIAKNIKSNIREIEGALNRLIARSALTKRDINLSFAEDALKDLISQSGPKKVTVGLIKTTVAQYYSIKPEDFESKKRTRSISYPRQIAMFLTRELIDSSLLKIGEEFGGRDHTTVIHAVEKIQKDILEDSSLRDSIDKMRKDIIGD
jgi:chromosomal replication initiator protein